MSVFKRILIIFGGILLGLIGAFLLFVFDNYDAKETSKKYLISSENVKVTEEKEWFFFDGSGDENVFIFYPGAKVEEIAYSKIMNEISEKGIDCYLLKLPFRLAFFNSNGPDPVISNSNYKKIFLGGHSLGGVVAGKYAQKNKVDGLVLIESRASVKLDDNLKVLSIYATNDGILNKEKYEESKELLPVDFKEVIIEGGNHANIADYGHQKGDNQASITKEEQQAQTVQAIFEFISENK